MVKIATYNVRNLFDDYTDDGSSNPKPRREVEALVRSIDALNADVIGVQEVESLKALNEVNARLRNPYSSVRLQKGNSHRGIHLGFLSRHPITLTSHRQTELTYSNGRPMLDFTSEEASQSGTPEPLKIQRDALLARVILGDGQQVAILNLHLKSQRDYSWMRHRASEIRAAEARAVRKIVSNSDEPIDLILGDFNEKTDKWPIRPITQKLNVRDPIYDEIEAEGLASFTYHPYRYRSRIDYLLPVGEFKARYRAGSIRIHRSRIAEVASDHYPISASFG